MKAKSFAIVVMTVIAATAVCADHHTEKPHIVIMATGGTIAGSANSGTQAGYDSGQVGVDVLIDAVPELEEIAEITGEQIANVGSQNMNDEVWLTLAKRINEVAKDEKVDGIVITHGTDTMEETCVLPQSRGQDRETGGAHRLHAAVHGAVGRRPAEHL